ncbi:MAG: hypothetical protein QOC99_1186 [Acidobacteriota bacterium]|nr:hypothetical protein [Acidobacteriota bacterium]
MKKRLTSLFLLLLTGSTLAGVPTHSGERECHMSGKMDCCAKARMRSNRPEVKASRLCCALNCTEPGTTTPTASFRVSTQLAVVLGNVLVPRISFLQSPIPARSSPTPGQRQDSNPAYILHLALLI